MRHYWYTLELNAGLVSEIRSYAAGIHLVLCVGRSGLKSFELPVMAIGCNRASTKLNCLDLDVANTCDLDGFFNNISYVAGSCRILVQGFRVLTTNLKQHSTLRSYRNHRKQRAKSNHTAVSQQLQQP